MYLLLIAQWAINAMHGMERLAQDDMIQACMEHSVMELVRKGCDHFSDW